jgi:hypothetical protein
MQSDKEQRHAREQGAETSALTTLLLVGGVLAGPIYLVAGLAQALARPGFDITQYDLSLLSLGRLGWIQIANFIASGLLTIAGAVGIRRAIGDGRGSTWGPLLIGVYGAALVGAGCFSADPVPGFPPEMAASAGAISWHGALHLLCAATGFFALIGAMFVLARRWGAQEERVRAGYSRATGVLFLTSFMGAVAGRGLILAMGGNPALTVIGLWIGVALAWIWISLVAAWLMTGGEGSAHQGVDRDRARISQGREVQAR